MSTVTATSQLRMPDGKRISDFAVMLFEDAGQWFIRLEVIDTQDWPLGEALLDVQFILSGGDIFSTSTAAIRICKDQTW